MSRRLRRSLLVAASLVASLAAAELAVRVFLPQPRSWMAIYRPHPTLPTFAVAPGIDEVADDGETRWRVRTDGEGLRLRSDGGRLGSGNSIVLLGDSFTFGYGVDSELCFAGLLEARLAARARVINAGQPGYGPCQELLLLEHLFALGMRPSDVVLVVYAGNDVLDAALPTDREVHAGSIDELPSWRERLQQNSHLYRLLARAYHRWWRRTPHFVHDWRELMRPKTWEQSDLVAGMDAMRCALVRMLDACAAHGARLHAAVLPPTAAVDVAGGRLPEADLSLCYELPVEQMLYLLQEVHIEAIDLTPALATLGSSDAFLAFDGHLSPSGHAAVAAALQQALPSLRP